MAFLRPFATYGEQPYTAQDIRQVVRALSPADGVLNNGLLVSAGSGMNSTVAVGSAVVSNGSPSSFQGAYLVTNTSLASVPHATADATNPRIDTIVLKVYDAHDGGDSVDQIPAPLVITGTPTSGATLANLSGAGSVPANSMVLAYVLVLQTVTSALSFFYSDVRPFANVNPWFPLTLATGISVMSGKYVPSCRLEPGGVVRLKGAIQNTSGSSIAMGASLVALPLGFRPASNIQMPMWTSQSPFWETTCLVETSGGIAMGVAFGASAALSFDDHAFTLT